MRTAVLALLTILAVPALTGMAAMAEGRGASAAEPKPPPRTDGTGAAEARPVADIERRVAQFSPTPLAATQPVAVAEETS